MTKNDIDIVFDKKRNCFLLSCNGITRAVIDDLELNFRMTRVSLRSERVNVLSPLKKHDYIEYPVNIRTVGSSRVIKLSDRAGSFYAKDMGEAILLGYKSNIGESHFSPDQAMRLVFSEFPGIDTSILYRNRSDEFQNFDCEGLWWSQADFGEDLARDFDCDSGLLALWKYKDSLVAGMLPVTNKQMLGKLRTEHGGGISAVSGSGTSCQVIEDFSLVLIAFGDEPLQVVDKLLRSQKMLNPKFSLESDTELPGMFNSLGWCSWDAFGKKVTQEDVKRAIDTFKEKSIPVRYLLCDDGWLSAESEIDSPIGEGISTSKLTSLLPDSKKFPDMKELVEYAKRSGIESVGLWHSLNGYWNGISKSSDLYRDNPGWFFENSGGDILPDGNTLFYMHWYTVMKQWGIDFVKVDNQAFHRRMLPYEKNIACYMAQLQKSLNDASRFVGFPVIYCMATHPEVIFNSGENNLFRVSNDFKSNDPFSAKKHIVNSFYNTVWLGKIFHPDFDMFQSYDCFAETYAKMLCISGSPIYLTDVPDAINIELLSKIVMPTGEIPRFDTLPLPLRENFFVNPYEQGNILAVYTKYNDTKTLGLFNTVMTGQAVSSSIVLEDLLEPGRDYFMYSDSGDIEPRVVCSEDGLDFFIRNMNSDVITFAPISDGIAVVGIIDYYAAPTLVSAFSKVDDGWEVMLKCPGTLLLYSEKEPSKVYCDNISQDPSCIDYNPQNGMLKICVPGKKVRFRF